MRILLKNRMYIRFPDPLPDQDGWEINGARLSRKETDAMTDEAIAYERTVNRLQVSKLLKQIKPPTNAR